MNRQRTIIAAGLLASAPVPLHTTSLDPAPLHADPLHADPLSPDPRAPVPFAPGPLDPPGPLDAPGRLDPEGFEPGVLDSAVLNSAVLDPAVLHPAVLNPAAAAHDLVEGLARRPWGSVSPSIYETARLVALAPWLTGHTERLRFIGQCQRRDGAWGAGDGYDLVPTLSATDAALACLLRGPAEHDLGEAVAMMAQRGLWALRRLLAGPPRPLPDTAAIEIIVPGLVAALNASLDRLRERLDYPWADDAPLPLPAGLDGAALTAIRSLVESGAALPAKLLHSLEVAAPLPSIVRAYTPIPHWTVGASPAATAAWLGEWPLPSRRTDALRYLEKVIADHAGPVPSVIPITTFERAWVLTSLVRTGVALPQTLWEDEVDTLEKVLGDTGTSGGAGLPPDADTTSVTLFALEQVGRHPDLDCLLEYQVDGYFCTWAGERTASVSTNAHVLDALGARLAHQPGQAARYGAARDHVVSWLCDQQLAEGSWTDKWHASPLYATMCCALALGRYGGGQARAALRRCLRWVIETQRPDGAWGRWSATREETAYALSVLMTAYDGAATAGTGGPDSDGEPGSAEALARGYHYLRQASWPRVPGESATDEIDPPLWHDKDLYRPTAVVHASIVAALHGAGRWADHQGFDHGGFDHGGFDHGGFDDRAAEGRRATRYTPPRQRRPSV